MSSPRSFTLIEVLFASTLLTLCALTITSAVRASYAAPTQEFTGASAAHLTLADEILREHREEIYAALPGGSLAPQDESPQTWTLMREECPDCPEGIGRFMLRIEDAHLTFFHRVALGLAEQP